MEGAELVRVQRLLERKPTVGVRLGRGLNVRNAVESARQRRSLLKRHRSCVYQIALARNQHAQDFVAAGSDLLLARVGDLAPKAPDLFIAVA